MITVVAMKNLNMPVAANLDRSIVYLAIDKVSGAVSGKGYIDLSSYNSHLLERDLRVQKWIFGLEKKPSNGVVEFAFDFSKHEKAFLKKHGLLKAKGDMTVRFNLDGVSQEMVMPVQISRTSSKQLEWQTPKETRFTYANESKKDSLLSLLEECNHEYLSTFVDISINASFRSICD